MSTSIIRCFPRVEREYYLPIDYVSPLDWRNRRVLGFDMLSDAIRRQAIERSLESGDASLSGPVASRHRER